MRETRATAADAFGVIWAELSDVLGTAATAAIVRRAARKASARQPTLVELVVSREQLEHSYATPASWQTATEDGALPQCLRELVAEVGSLLVELTGSVVVARMEELPQLQALRPVWRERGNASSSAATHHDPLPPVKART